MMKQGPADVVLRHIRKWVVGSRDGEPPDLEPLPDDLEGRAHEVAAGRARARRGK